MVFELRQYDTVLMTFELGVKYLEGQFCEIISINEKHSVLLPIGMGRNSDDVLSWLKTRVVPQNRAYVDQLLSKNNLTHNDTLGIIKLCKGLSLNDSYWVVEQGFSGKFADYNLYENDFTKILSLVAYSGYGSAKAKGLTSSPEFTTNGMLRKGWRKLDGHILLFKGGTSGAANTEKEPYSEFYASQIARKMGLNHINYGLAKWKKSLCSTCELFTDINTSYVPMWRFVGKCGLKSIAKFLKGLGDEFYNEFADMLIFDAVIFNTDRHLGNFGILVDNKLNVPIRFAPIFDNGLSLFNYAMDNDINDLKKYAKTRISAFDVPFEDIVSEFISERQKAQLNKLINFKFDKHTNYNLPAERLKKIEAYLQLRVCELLK